MSNGMNDGTYPPGVSGDQIDDLFEPSGDSGELDEDEDFLWPELDEQGFIEAAPPETVEEKERALLKLGKGYKRLRIEQDLIKAQIQKLQRMSKSIGGRMDWHKEQMEVLLPESGKFKDSLEGVSIYTMKLKDRLVIDESNPTLIEFYQKERTVVEKYIDKKAIERDLLEGNKVAGASIVTDLSTVVVR